MSKVVAIAASLKAVMLIATGAFARGDMLPVILISAIFDLGLQIRRKAGHTETACTAGDYQLSQKGAVIVDPATPLTRLPRWPQR
jgi:hypothetical protein